MGLLFKCILLCFCVIYITKVLKLGQLLVLLIFCPTSLTLILWPSKVHNIITETAVMNIVKNKAFL